VDLALPLTTELRDVRDPVPARRWYRPAPAIVNGRDARATTTP
jgi:hypothetical protein